MVNLYIYIYENCQNQPEGIIFVSLTIEHVGTAEFLLATIREGLGGGSHFVFVWKNERVSNDSNLPWGKHMIKLHREICLISMKCAGPILVEPYFSCKRSWLWIYHLQNRLMRNVPLSCLSKGRFPPCNSTDITSPWRRTRHGGSAMWIICFLEYGNQWT